MDYVNLGRTGLRVSRACLGMMSYGEAREPPVGARRGAGGTDRPPGRRGQHHLLRLLGRVNFSRDHDAGRIVPEVERLGTQAGK